ncbi:MAG: HAD family hydrolase [Pseudomonadota bacterium]|nr:HAD family hydrolase [Pseudomonadota bacterium]
MIRAVVFDVGETFIDETRHWGEWADWLGVPRLTFFAVLGATIERGEHHRAVFDHFRSGFDIDAETQARQAAGWIYGFEPKDFYPDAVPCLRRLRVAGYRIGVAGNQPQEAEAALRAAGVAADFIASSASWGVEKPSAAFFDRVAEAAWIQPVQIAYVGDRLDNDILPALHAGMTAIHIRRGPWGYIHSAEPTAGRPSAVIHSLDELPEALVAAVVDAGRARTDGG